MGCVRRVGCVDRSTMLKNLRLISRRGPFCRQLGTWASKFEEARGASLAIRRNLCAELKAADALHLEQDEDESKAMATETNMSVGSQLTFVLSVEGTAVGILRAALMPQGHERHGGVPTGLMIGAQVDPALTLSAIGPPLIGAAKTSLLLRGASRVMAVAPLSGLCQWVVENRGWEELETTVGPDAFSADQPEAVEAVAKGVPRKGHSVLGVGTFKAARPAFMKLAEQYAAQSRELPEADDLETAMYLAAGGEIVGVNWMHAQDEDALRDCAGCTASIRF